MPDFQIENDVLTDYLGWDARVVVPEGVRRIARSAFERRKEYIESVVVPEGVIRIDDGALACLPKLADLTLPGSLKAIPVLAFSDFAGLRSLILGEGLEVISNLAFSGCRTLRYVSLPGSVSRLPDSVFKDLPNLETVTLHEGMTEIPCRMFENCTGLKSVLIPGSVTKIGNQAFVNCASLREIAIPDAVTEIGRETFWDCAGLTGFAVGARNPNYMSEDGVLYDRAGTTLLRYPPGRPGQTFVVPDRVTEFGDCAFQGARNLLRVMVPATVRKLGGAFRWCESLEGAILADGVEEIAYDAFYGCKRLRRVIIPDSVTEIGDMAFYNCGLESIVFPDGLTRIGKQAFYGCDLKEVIVPASVRSIGEKAFGFYRGFWEFRFSLTIVGDQGSEAERYARENKIRFVPL